MSRFNVGDSVIYVTSNDKGIVTKVFPAARGRQLYQVNFHSVNKNCLESNLLADTDLDDPFQRLKKGIFSSFSEFSMLSTSFKIQNTSNNTISSLKASNTIFKAYQFKPLLKFLNSDNKRILVADEVGLGKTIEAGHIMMELMARRELKNALIICPKSLQEKWQAELKQKFNFQFRIYNKLADFLSDLNVNYGSIKAILNYEKVRSPKDENRSGDLFDLIEDKNIQFDFVLCDEAHRLRNHTTQTFKGAKKVLSVTRSTVFLTATPIMISEQNLFNLLNLLDEEHYSEYSTFQNQIAVNYPFVNALIQLNSSVPFKTIYNDLSKSTVDLYYKSGEEYGSEYKLTKSVNELFNEIPLYLKITDTLLSKSDTPETRVQLQFDISDMSEMNKIFSRTRKKEVTQDWSQAIREPHNLLVELFPEERKLFDEVIETYTDQNLLVDHNGEQKMSQGFVLGLIQKKRQIASSVYGTINSTNNLENGIDVFAGRSDAKIVALLEIIDEVVIKRHKKLIVFALFKNTLRYLRLRLSKQHIKSAIIHGDISDRYSEINRFKNDPKVQILLSSEVGSEGLDMQFCDAVVNYDLPWNPMVVEQRIGRVDRFGQKSPKVHIYNLIVKDSIQEDIYIRLLDRIGIFRGVIGDIEAILDKDLEQLSNPGISNIREWFVTLEKELYSSNINREERRAKIDAIERAIVTEQKNLEDITEGLTNTLTNDSYFRKEISDIQKNNKYVTEKELVNYMQLLIRKKLPTCQIFEVDASNMVYSLKIPVSSPNTLINFLNDYSPNDPETNQLFSAFANSIRRNTELLITFSQETGYADKDVIRINAYHPIIIATLAYFKSEFNFSNSTFRFALNRSSFGDKKIKAGNYLLGIYSTTVIKKLFKKDQVIELMVPILYNLDSGSVIADRDLVDEITGFAQLNAQAYQEFNDISENIFDKLEYTFAVEINDLMTKNLEDQNMRLESHKKLQIQRKTEYFNNRIKTQENIIRSSEDKLDLLTDESAIKNIQRILPVQRKNLADLIHEKENAIIEINSRSISSQAPTLISLSHIIISE